MEMDCEFKEKAATKGYCIGTCGQEQHEFCCVNRAEQYKFWYMGFFRTIDEMVDTEETK